MAVARPLPRDRNPDIVNPQAPPPHGLRRATERDVAGVTACVCAAYLPWIPVVGRQPGPMLEDYAEVIAAREVYVAERGGEIVGVLVVVERERSIFIDNVAVAPAVRGNGIGRRLLEFAEAEARRRGLGETTLSTHERMTANRDLYARIGYVDEGHRVVDGYPRVFMRKPLA